MNAARRQPKSVNGSTQAMGRSPGAYEAPIAVTRTARRYISLESPGEPVSALKQVVRRARERMVERTPDSQTETMF